MSTKIFISYRRDDIPSEALSIGQFLERELGRGSVFMDIDIHAGLNFPAVLDKQLTDCKVLLALIGPGWLDARDREGQRRLEDPRDWVRLEISNALARKIAVIPVCVNHDKLPERSELPENLQGLLDYQAAFVSTSRFRNDMAALVQAVRAVQLSPRRWLVVAFAALFVLIAGTVWIDFRQSSSHAHQPTTPVTQLPQPSTSTPVSSTIAPSPSKPREDATPKPVATTNPSTTEAFQSVPGGNTISRTQKQSESVPMQGSIQLRSDPGDFIGAGKSLTVGDSDGLFTGSVNRNVISITYHGDDWWYFTFAAPEGQQLKEGTYLDAHRSPFNSPVKPGLSVTGASRGCNTLTGQFSIKEITYAASGSKLKRFVADFEQHCEGKDAALYGTVDLTATH